MSLCGTVRGEAATETLWQSRELVHGPDSLAVESREKLLAPTAAVLALALMVYGYAHIAGTQWFTGMRVWTGIRTARPKCW